MNIRGTNICVDSFFGKAPVLLSHYHRDHMSGLSLLKPGQLVFCSPTTAALLTSIDHVPRGQVRTVGDGQTFQPVPGTMVTAFDANHCPGALMFSIRTGGKNILYTGDFRLNDTLCAKCSPLAPVDLLYLDTTYDSPRYRFPPQQKAIRHIIELVRASNAEEILVAVYTVGKDRILQAVWREFGRPFYVTPKKFAVCTAMGSGAMVTRDKAATPFRAYARGYLERYFKLQRSYRERRTLVVIPTGWAVDAHRRDPTYHYVPYSEHCDYAELHRFKELVRPSEIVRIS